MNYEQKKIDLDNQFKVCWAIRKSIPERIMNIDYLIKRIKQVNNQNIGNFLKFIEDLAGEVYKKQRNNHNYMKTFLDEKVNTYDRIQYHLLEECLIKGKLSYAANLAPKRIMSNYFLSNYTEELLSVDKLETAFRKFTRSERSFLESGYRNVELKIINAENSITQVSLKINDDEIYEGEIEDIKRYFALQITRREYFLYDILKKCFPNKENFESLDLLDYLYCKYIYNESLIPNYNNWLESIGNDVKVYQIEYKKCLLDINYEEAKNLKDNLTEEDYADSRLAMTEIHTFILDELLKSIKLTYLNNLLEINGIAVLSNDEIEMAKHILVTVGSGTKLCFLITGGVKADNNFFNKVNFIIHGFWDQIMTHKVLLNLLLKKDSKINNIEYFKKANIDKEIFTRAKFMFSALKASEDFEKKIKK